MPCPHSGDAHVGNDGAKIPLDSFKWSYMTSQTRGIAELPEPCKRGLCCKAISRPHDHLLEPLCRSFQTVPPKIRFIKDGTLNEPEEQNECSIISAHCFQKPRCPPEIFSHSGLQLCTKDQGSPKEPRVFLSADSTSIFLYT